LTQASPLREMIRSWKQLPHASNMSTLTYRKHILQYLYMLRPSGLPPPKEF
jgi:hypothetical protein